MSNMLAGASLELSFPTESPPRTPVRDRSAHRRTRERLAGAVVSALTDTRGLLGTPLSRIVEHDPVKSARRKKKEADSEEVGELLDRKCARAPVVDLAGRGEEEGGSDPGGRRAKVGSSSRRRDERSRGRIQMRSLRAYLVLETPHFPVEPSAVAKIHSDVTSPVVSHADTHFLYLFASATRPSPPSPRGV